MAGTTHFAGTIDAVGGFAQNGTALASVTAQTAPTPTNTAPYTIRTDTVAHCAADAQAAINALAVDLAAAVAAAKTAGVFK